MKRFAILLITLLALTTLWSIACGSGGEQSTTTPTLTTTQPTGTPITTATPTQAATGGDIGKTRQNSNLKVTLDTACIAYNPNSHPWGNFLNVTLTCENIGTSRLNIEDYWWAFISLDGVSHNHEYRQRTSGTWHYGEGGLYFYPNEVFTCQIEFPYIPNTDYRNPIPTDKDLPLTVYAEDSAGQGSTLQFTIPASNALSECPP
jgi:hypothetical protein